MPFKMPDYRTDSIKLAAVLVDPISIEDQAQLIQWLKGLSIPPKITISFNHSELEINKKIVFSFLDNFDPEIQYDIGSLTLTCTNLSLKNRLTIVCTKKNDHMSNWVKSYFANTHRKITTIKFSIQPDIKLLDNLLAQNMLEKLTTSDFIWDKKNKSVKFFNVTEKKLDTINSLLEEKKELNEIDLSNNNLDLETVLPKFLKVQWAKNVALKIDDIVLIRHEIFEVDVKNFKLINTIRNNLCSVKKIIFRGTFHDQFELQSFLTKVYLDKNEQKKLAKKLTNLQEIEFSSRSNYHNEAIDKRTWSIKSKEAFPTLSEQNNFQEVLLCIARRNVLLMKMKDDKSPEEIFDLMKYSTEPLSECNDLDLSNLFLKNEHLALIKQYFIANNKISTIKTSNFVWDKKNKSIKFFDITEKYLDTINSMLEEIKELDEVDLSNNNFKLEAVLPKLLNAQWTKNIILKLDDIVLTRNENTILFLEVDVKNLKLINTMKNTLFPVKKFILKGAFNDNNSAKELLSTLEDNQSLQFELQSSFAAVKLKKNEQEQLAKKLTNLQEIDFFSYPDSHEESIEKKICSIKSKEAFPKLSEQNNFQEVLLCIARRNVLLMKMKSNLSPEEILALMKCSIEPLSECSNLELSNLFLQNEHLDLIKQYFLANTKISTVDLINNTLEFEKLINFIHSAIKVKRTIILNSNIFSIRIQEGVVDFISVNSTRFSELSKWWQDVNPTTNEFQVRVQELETPKTPKKFVNDFMGFLDFINPLDFLLDISENLINELSFINLFEKIVENKISFEVKTEEFIMKDEKRKINAINIHSTLMMSFLKLYVEYKYQVKSEVLDQMIFLFEACQDNTSLQINSDPKTNLTISMQYLNKLTDIIIRLTNDVCNSQSFGAVLLKLSTRNEILKKLENNEIVLRENQNDHNRLDLNNLWLIDQQIPKILGYLKKNEHIQTIIFDHNTQLNSNGLVQLFEGLKSIPWITSLSLNEIGVGFDSKVMDKLQEYLKFNLLLTLKIKGNFLDDKALVQIKNIVNENKSLFCLDIRNNNFSDTYTKPLAEALCNNHILTKFLFDKISSESSLDTFFTEIGWELKKSKKVIKKFNYRLEKIQVLDPISKPHLDHEFKSRNLSPESKEMKKIIENYKKYQSYGEERQKETNSSLIATAHEGKNLQKFKELLENASPYTLAQAGYLQHILVDAKDTSFLEYLFDTFNVNPWLRFNSKTILDLAQEKGCENFITIIEKWMNELKNPVNTPFNKNLSSIKMTNLKKRTLEDEKFTSTKKVKHEKKSEEDNLPLNPNKQTLHAFADENNLTKIDNTYAAVIDLPKATQSLVDNNTNFNIPFIMQLIFMQQDTLLKMYWQLSTAKEFWLFTQMTPLQYALNVKSIKCLKTLLELGEDINQKDEKKTPLLYQFISCFYEKDHAENEVDQHISILQALLKYGADVSIKVTAPNVKKDTAIHLAARMNNYRTVKMLLTSTNCTLNEENSNNLTPLQEAINTKNIKLVARLLLDRRHKRSKIVNAKEYANSQNFLAIKPLFEQQLSTIAKEDRTSGLQWSSGLYVQFKKPKNGNKSAHTVSLDKEHAWLQTQNDFVIQSLTIKDPQERLKKLEQLGNPVTASLTFVMTATSYARHVTQQYIDITVPLDNVPSYHLIEAFNETENNNSLNNLEREAVVASQKVLELLPSYQNFRQGYQPRSADNITSTSTVDFNQTFRHGERSLLTYLSDKQHVHNIVQALAKQPGFVAHAKCVGVILNVASPRYVCENCEVAILATQNSITSSFLSLLSNELKEIDVQLSQFHAIRMITCVSSFIPFHTTERISGIRLLDIDIRENDVILTKDVGQIFKKEPHTQFKSNQL